MAVRRERVILELEDRFSGPLGRPAAATKAFEKTLGDLDRTSVRTERSQTRVSDSVTRTGRSSSTASREIDRFSGRLRLLADVAAILGPALVPIGAVAIPAVTGLAAQFGAAALGAGTALIAFQGVGDALEAVNEAALEPSTKNLEAARLAMEKLAPETRDLVNQIQEMRPAFAALRDAAAAGLFPGLSRALDEAEGSFDRVERVLFAVGDAAGDVTAEFAEGIAGPRGQEFLAFIEAEVPGALRELGQTVGNLVGGLAELWMAFTPLNRDFSGWLLDASESFDQWAQGLAQTDGFREFVAYLRENGPRVADALGAIGGALLDIVEAAAPVGAALLPVLEAVADVIGAIADSDAGPTIMATVTALALLNRGMATFQSVGRTAWATNIRSAETFTGKLRAARLGRIAGGLAGVGLAASGMADDFGLANAATGALVGSIAGPWGAAIGGGVGLLIDFASANDEAAERAVDLASSLDQQTGAITANTRAKVADKLETDGILRSAEELGLSLSTVTDAALGNGDALAELEALQQGYNRAAREAIGAKPGEITSYEQTTGALYEKGEAVGKIVEALGGEASALGKAQDATRRKAAATGELTESYRRGESAAQAFAEGVSRLNRILEGRATVRDYRSALLDLRDALKRNGNTLDTNTRKGIENQAALDNIVGSAIKVAEGMRGTNRVEFLKRARGDFVDATAKLLGGREAARELWDRLVQLDRQKARPTITVDDSGAVSTISEVDRWLNIINGKRATTYIDTIRTGARSVPGIQMAGGGTVPGKRHPYGDKTLIFAAPSEEIITNRNGEADRFRADRAAGRIPAYANGGTVAAMNHAGAMPRPTAQTVKVVAGGEPFDYERLARELARVRPIHGDVHISGDPTVFRREMQNDERAANLGGF